MDCEQYIARVALYLVGYQRVQVRMEVEIFAEGVDRHNDGWDAVRLAKRIPQKVTH